ncbi:coiled-coil domain-containing protein 167 isoform X5 [Bubalus kerabau]|uniref:coiled-coil domain-containing protein 167 isoform X5 n=1 Tax=Bubalus bubalis TaxID=89462 RepID=UPI000DBC57AF|nr:coiled-coil domain-containing protein 167 isoform X5 [Bubalus bubalis]XP_055427511.1 coiled-coil domain-containing protein 167 isoform X5 [Bubalus carabanensis]
MTKKKRENLGVALEVRGETGAAACRELLPAADDRWAGEEVVTMSERPGGRELQALWGGAELRGQEVSGEGEKQPDEQSLQLWS